MHMEAAGLLEILAHTPALQTATISGLVSDDTDLRDRSHANLHQLRSMKLACADMTGEELNRAVVSHISFPSSAEVEIVADYMDEEVDFDLLITAVRGVWPQSTPLSVTISPEEITFRPSEVSECEGFRTVFCVDWNCLRQAIPVLKT